VLIPKTFSPLSTRHELGSSNTGKDVLTHIYSDIKKRYLDYSRSLVF